ncbi:uncharacterized protein LOC126829498 [Patella vulgata]|uniref:uncharacterized protein LOC126829498 n=1 Tax=Patella vulgata TaxID=6465 RepID=UPI0024A91BCF|nr:uncharacterized protein LOC126829498 [Patella vulgata]
MHKLNAMCNAISFCNLETCTSSNNQVCVKCEGVLDEKAGFRAYKVSANKKACDKACSWRSSSTPCYPGSCPTELANSCRCTSGFTGTRCERITVRPNILENIATLKASNGDTTDAPPDTNKASSQDTVWTNNVNPTSLNYRFTAEYQPQVPSRQAYINNFKVGIIGGSLQIARVGGRARKSMDVTCGSANSKTNPNQGVFSCAQTLTNLAQLSPPFIHGEWLQFSMVANNGGFIKIENKETKLVETSYLTGLSQTSRFSITFDTVNPFHCKPKLGCTKTMLTDVDLSQSKTVKFSWDGWSDTDSGLKDYEYELFELHRVGNELGTNQRILDSRTTSKSVDITFPKTAVYSVILSAYDKAGNYKKARRLVIFDDSSSVTTTQGSVLRATSALSSTNYKWQTNLNSVTISWTNRFINTVHHNGRFLAAVKSEPGVESQYDDNDGSRTTQAVDNVQGIVKFLTAFKTDHKGGSTMLELPNSSFKDIGIKQTVTITPNVKDGDTLAYAVSAVDIVGRFRLEMIYVNFDSTAPVVENLWLTKGNEVDLAVHGVEELDKLVIEWVAYDDHSGIETVEWKILDHLTQIEHGSQHVPPQGETTNIQECQTKYASDARGHNCYCIPLGSCYHRHFQIKPSTTTTAGEGILNNKNAGTHDHDYRIVITVMNQAKLKTTVTKKITIDTSPPHEGPVHDGKYGTPEVDFQQDRKIFTHWEGFFDRESGVKFYQYGFGKTCLDTSKFALDLAGRDDVKQTTATHASWTAPSDGKYYITVVAYNRALEVSKPVCSDGVVVDRTLPTIREIDIEGARIKGGLIKENNQVSFISDTRRRYLLKDPDTACMNKAQGVEVADLFPYERFSNGSIHHFPAEMFCSKDPMSNLFMYKMYLSMHSHIYVNWTAQGSLQNIGIYDYEFGLASSRSSVSAPDLLPFTSTHHHSWYQGYHPQLSDGTEFYISIKATNKAGKETIRVLGPIIVHTIPPTFNGEVNVNFENGILKADWSGETVSDPESTQLKFTAAVGSSDGAQDVLPYSPLKSAGSCNLATPPSCTGFTLVDLHWNLHHSFTYYVSIRVENIVGLYSVFTSKPYVHNTRKPATGVVFEVVQPEETAIFGVTELEDSDFQLSTSKLTARWFGFESDDLAQHITYSVGIGSKPYFSDIAEENIGIKTMHTFRGIGLELHKTYYVTVTAKSDAGMTKASSNGITIVKKDSDLSTTVQINDGPGCNQQDDELAWLPNHHAQQIEGNCKSDIDYQISTSIYLAHWTISDQYQHIYPDVKWTLQVRQKNTDDIWSNVLDKNFLSNSGRISQTVTLDYCKTYRSSVKFCSGDVCSQPVVSNGVTIFSEPDKPKMKVDYKKIQGSQLVVGLTYQSNTEDKACSVESSIDKYMWSLTDNKHSSHLFTKWNKVNGVQKLSETQFQFTINLDGEVDFSECRRLAIRIFNKAGLSTIISSDIKNCSAIDPVLITPAIVIDAIGQPVNTDYNTNAMGRKIKLELNAAWFKQDVDYTPYKNIISAVWPTLRHQNYKWGLIEDQSFSRVTHFTRNLVSIRDPCSHPSVLVCGESDKEFINIFPLESLKHGRRYHICIHAEAKNTTHEKWQEDLAEVNACSDGITVDLTPPTGGRVWVENLKDFKYQSSSSDVTVYWDNFIDVEENGGITVHPSGISQYHLSIGSVEGGEDIVTKHSVGLINHKIFHHLSLQNGHTYYVTIQATDFVNRTKTLYSEGFIIDNSPPLSTHKPIQFTNTYIQSNDVLSMCWTGSFKDIESGISQYRWAIGSRPGHQDITKYTTTPNDCAEANVNGMLLDGHTYFVTVQAINGAGLSTTIISRPVTVDATPPTVGHVIDVLDSDGDDVDYITNQSPLSVRWQGFHDPHSSMKYYTVKVGTCNDCDDIIPEIKTGTSQFFTFPQSKLAPGIKYITTVTGCNMADMCTSAFSDGVIVDHTAPIVGRVQDGTKDLDIEYQATRKFVGAKWHGFRDTESGIEKYEWRVGTTTGGDELLKAQELPVVELAYRSNLPDNKLLPIDTIIYITVRCYNKAGLYSEVTSNGFMIDTTLPVVTKKVVLSSYSSILSSTVISKSSIKIEWKFTDDESDIERQYISISPHLLGDFNATAIEIPSVLTEYTFSSLDLHDGSKYKVKVIGCNLAGLCQSSITDDITVDSTPPTRGMFAVDTSHAAALHRDKNEWISWTINSINIAWLGFADLHTGISEYRVTVGTKPFFTDLNKDGIEATFQHVIGADFDDEGMVQTVTIDTKPLQIGSRIFISVWAINGVGFKSLPAHSEFELVEGGILDLVRRCQPYDCEGHCSCGAQDKKCSAALNCNDVSQGNPNNLIQVTDLVSTAAVQPRYTSSDNYLAARWRVTNTQGLSVIRYEISAGHSNEDTPTGIFDSDEDRTWFDVGENMMAFLALDKKLVESISYSIFVRAWYGTDKYAVFKSPGIVVLTSAPSLGRLAGSTVKELETITSTKDIDYQTSSNQVIVGWKNKFRGGIHGLDYFKPYLSTHPQGHNVHETPTNIAENEVVYTATGLNLQEAKEYYSTVLAYNKAGLVSWANSDGILIDNTPPTSGIIHDGDDMHDKDYQSSSSMVSASWYGFSDSDSGIVKYYWCIGTDVSTTGCNILDWKNVGLNTRVSVNLTTPLNQDAKIYCKVYAVDGSGLKSEVAVSDGMTIDTTRPVPVDVEYIGENLIKNPSFEENVTESTKECDDQLPANWEADSSSCIKTVQSESSVSNQGRAYIKVKGGIQQTVSNLNVQSRYHIVVHVGYPHDVTSQHRNIEGFVQLGKEIHPFNLDPQRCQGLCDVGGQPLILWNKFTYVFQPTESIEVIKIGTNKLNMILAVDDVYVQQINYIDITSDSNHLIHHTVFRPYWSSLHLTWHFKDDQSPITDYQWALGTVKGGTQIQSFTSVGRNQHATATGLKLAHNTLIYLTVLSTNAAGLTTVSKSESIIVDMTPPVISEINDGLGADVSFQLTRIVSVNWKITDKESGIHSCQWAIGSTRDSVDIQPFIPVPNGQSFAQVEVPENLIEDSREVYSTVRCYNKAGLPTTATTDGVLVINKMSVNAGGQMDILKDEVSEYPVKNECHPLTNALRLQWNLESGGVDTKSIQVSVVGPGSTLDKEVRVIDIGYNQAKLRSLSLQPNSNYNVSVSTINVLGRQDNSLSTVITSKAQPPVLQDLSKIKTANSFDGKTMEISWREAFVSTWKNLYYEVSLGTALGGADIMQWQETTVPSLSIRLPDKAKTPKLYLTLTTIDPCGLSLNYNHTIVV